MRETKKVINFSVEGTSYEVRITKMDAFSGASLLRMLTGIPESKINPTDLITYLSDEDLKRLMRICLEYAEVNLPAGWNPIMVQGEWTFPEFKYETGICLRIMIEEVFWTMKGFFPEGGLTSRKETQNT